MPLKVSLEDCTLKVGILRTLGNPKGVTLYLGLPKMIDLAGMLSDVPTHGSYHERFIGASGELYIACDNHARFWPKEYLERKHAEDDLAYACNISAFVSSSVGRQFQNFTLIEDDVTHYLDRLQPGAENRAIINTLNSHFALEIFFRRFFEWVTEFAQKHGEKRYLDRETFYKRLYA